MSEQQSQAKMRPRSVYGVTKRACANNEPAFVVYSSGAGAPADSVAHFFSQLDAEEYCDWKNGKKKHHG